MRGYVPHQEIENIYDVDDGPMMRRRERVMNVCVVQVMLSFVLVVNARRAPALAVLQPFFLAAGVLGYIGARRCNFARGAKPAQPASSPSRHPIDRDGARATFAFSPQLAGATRPPRPAHGRSPDEPAHPWRSQDDEGSGKVASIGSILSGVICALGWYVWMAICLMPSAEPDKYEWDCNNHGSDAIYVVPCQHKAGAYWAPGILMTLGVIMPNIITWESVTEDAMEEGCGVAAKAKCWVTFTFIIMFCSLGGSIWIIIQARHATRGLLPTPRWEGPRERIRALRFKYENIQIMQSIPLVQLLQLIQLI